MKRRAQKVWLLPAVLAAFAGCHPSTPAPPPTSPPLLGQDCDPMVPTQCGFPFPSNVWTVQDSTQQTGMHVFFGKTTLPLWFPNHHLDPTPWLNRDGFSPGAAIMTHLPNATVTGLPDPDHIDQSTAATSPTLLMEADTATFVAHWDELDETTTDDTERSFFMRPAARLKDATRYIVAIRNVVDATGTPLTPNPVFQALRDNSASADPTVPLRRQLYADILGKLKSAGVDTSSLQLAWDFTTASKVNTTQWMVQMRDDALMRVGSAGPTYTITQVTDNPDPYIRRRINGNMTVPLYLNNPNPGASINFGSNGLPAVNSATPTATFPFLLQIPNSLVNSGRAGAVIQNAHGLFGDMTEGQDGYMAEICDRLGYVEIAVNLIGMADDDGSSYVPNLLGGDIGQFEHVVERLHQGFLNELLAMRMMIGGMSQDLHTIFNGKPTIDPASRFYRGDSQGGISGGVYMAISTDVTRGLLGEPGAPYNLLLDRSVDFSGFFILINLTYPRPLDMQFILDLIQQLWDRAEPDGYISYISSNTLPCSGCPNGQTPSHNILIHDGIGDQQVTPLGAHFIARTVGAQNLETVNRELYGIQDAAPGFSGNGICEYNFWLPASQSPITDIPPDSSLPDPHDALRQLNSAQDMADTFFRTGVVVQTCADGGPCAAPMDWWDGGGLLTPANDIDGGTAPPTDPDGG
jgi:hypothetical protein